MPVSFNKQPATLQEKVDKAIKLTYHIGSVQDSEFMRAFILELLEKAFKRARVNPAGSGLAEFLDADDANVEIDATNTWLDNLKRTQE